MSISAETTTTTIPTVSMTYTRARSMGELPSGMEDEVTLNSPTGPSDNIDGCMPVDDDIPEPSEGGTSRKWTLGTFECSPALLQFLLPCIVVLIILIASVVGIFTQPENEIWKQCLTFLVGVIVPNPKLDSIRNKSRNTDNRSERQ